MDLAGNTHVNPHYLDNLLELSESADIEAGEDIYSAKGVKLLSKGSRLDPSMQERLIRHKLVKPLETSICLRSSFDDDWLQEQVNRLLQHELYSRIVGDQADAVRQVFARVETRQPGLDLLLALTQRFGPESLEHILLSSLLVVRLSLEAGLDEGEQKALALAGLLHEIGHLYLDATLRDKTSQHSLPAWRQLVAQPLISGMALSHLQGLAPTTVSAVREQHEKLDGSGYPVGTQGTMLAFSSQLFGVANMAARLLIQHGASGLWQTKIAMQLVPGEYSSRAVSAFGRLVMNSGIGMNSAAAETPSEGLPALFAHIGQLHTTLTELGERFGNGDKEAVWLNRMNQRLFTIQRTFSTTGLDSMADEDVSQEGQDIRTELLLISREIRRRLRDFGKTAVLQLAPLSPQMQNASEPWLTSLLNS